MPAAALVLALALANGVPGPPPARDFAPNPPAGRAVAAPREAVGARPRHIVSLRLDNDIVAGTDKDYSSGFSLALSLDGRGPLGGIWSVFGGSPSRLVSSYELGHVISTPANILAPVPDPSDRPYAGMLYGALATQALSGDRLDGLKLLAGVVGPASLAEPIQRAIHTVTLSDQARGWDYQLRNELLLNVFYEHRRRFTVHATPGGWTLQAIPRAGASAGNLLVQAQAEAYVRFGRHLPDDFGSSPARGLGNVPLPARHAATGSPNGTGAYVFAGAGVFFVARNLTLDGNTFSDGPRVQEKAHAVPAGEVGVSIRNSRFEATVSFVAWGREHAAQWRPCRYGSATLTYSY
ncbi:MAG TPA: lipid A deacylase LpxR family protein [Vicinamibacterales bacterium]|nr:lipid A deacylase LpxR family protein [Vicinamibacterales bacterium]